MFDNNTVEMNVEKDMQKQNQCSSQGPCPPDDLHYAPESGEPILNKAAPDSSNGKKEQTYG